MICLVDQILLVEQKTFSDSCMAMISNKNSSDLSVKVSEMILEAARL